MIYFLNIRNVLFDMLTLLGILTSVQENGVNLHSSHTLSQQILFSTKNQLGVDFEV